jgi:Oxidoreductase family, NAD-binding Rossmann fold/Oxidoreductase family, C-terminal alpha/beta domain
MPIFSRRDFVLSAGISLLSTQWSSGQRRTPASDKLTIACIGTGSQGLRLLMDLIRLPEVQIVSVCDVNRQSSDYLDWGPNELRDKVRLLLQQPEWGASLPGPTAGREVAQSIVNSFYANERGKPGFRACSAYEDFRELLSREKDLDAVAVSTPDHWHAVIAIAAMRAGKHIYSQKPMAHSVWEARAMAKVAKETGRATAVSIFNAGTADSRQVIDTIHSGSIGRVDRVDIWTKRPAAFWKQGLATPTTADPVPPGLNWDLWLGPAPSRAYNHVYLPFVWRAWYDYGCGAIGDMGEYGFDTIVRALNLSTADRVYASSTELFPDCFPVASTLHYRFPARSGNTGVELNWYDGGIMPARPQELAFDVDMSVGREGVMYSGTHGRLLTGFMAGPSRLLSPNGKLTLLPQRGANDVPFLAAHPEWGSSAVGAEAAHYREWIGACKGGPPATTNYAYEQPIVESLMLGNIAIRTQELLEWDATDFLLTRGSETAKALLEPSMREPWSLG